MTKAIITKITINNYQNSNNKKKKNKKTPTYIQKSLSSKIIYQSYKTTDAQHIGSKTARYFLQY